MNQKGQTLAEIVVALGIVLLLVTGLIGGGTTAIRTSDQSRLRSLAVSYNQEAIELTRKLRDENWTEFHDMTGLWCLDKDGVWTQAITACPINIDNTFTRAVTFSWNETNLRMDIVSVVSWQDGGATHQSTLTTFFTEWTINI
ncbi:hypothetical protein A3A79_00535 [Candidatus Gottesmanbacteria bacterium RIFCSPLOWO2_01_FULL_43_11b]|uniref:Type II secretion system protein GspI C-terminal domain-containing protein n=1 Tax=Candidatus Gottesmanbacteria bacterium RIFCSPLOWO2_01_FULL_43_11b TaxID=1798392 RepID=A0A1F6AG80_9BACT|nr:MAG: hypothetical protein A3A79_00535 [Candidatus Gottesmanbacteria bacterium RIFCSPLOWO2_01_FULL_43_11b]